MASWLRIAASSCRLVVQPSIAFYLDGGPLMEFQTSGSRRQFLSTVAMTAGAAIMLRPRLGWAADMTDPRVADIVAATIGIDTHNHVDVPLTAAEMPGPDIDLAGEMKRSGLSAICMTFATDYQPGDAYDRFLKGIGVDGSAVGTQRHEAFLDSG